MSDQEIYNRLSKKFFHSAEPEEILLGLVHLNDLHQLGELSTKDKFELSVYAFQTLQELTDDDPNMGESLILDHLLPLCIVNYTEAIISIHRLRECLIGWLNQYPEQVWISLREKVLERLYASLESEDTRAICLTISQIGYRTDKSVAILWNLIKDNDDEIGDTALSTLTLLGIPTNKREIITSELHKRVISRHNRSLAGTLARLADPKSVEVICDYWLNPDIQELDNMEASLVVSVVRDIIDFNYKDHNLQDKTWELLSGLVEEDPDKYSMIFYLGDIARKCNSKLVVPTMIEWLAQETEGKKNPSHRRYLLGLRLEDSVRPRQLEGLRKLTNKTAIELLHQDACQDTGFDGFASTRESGEKKQAWETALRLGHLGAIDWFDEAVEHETGKFVQDTIMKLIACFRIEPLPKIVVNWITERFDGTSNDGRELSRRMAAVRVARSTASREAFDALMNFGFTYEGTTLRQIVVALSEVALHLVSQGDDSVANELVEAIISRTQNVKHQREAAAFALVYIAENYPHLLLKHADRFTPLLDDSKREAYERGTLIQALGYLNDWQITPVLLNDMEGWALEPDRWIGGSSLDALARKGQLINNPHLIKESLGLQKIGNKWDLIPDTDRSEWTPYTIGFLYHQNPDEFLPAIVSLLNNPDWHAATQIMQWLQASHGVPERPALPQEIIDALINRIQERHSKGYGETDIFHLLADLAPEALVNENWGEYWGNWISDSRFSLANALGNTKLVTPSRNSAITQLQSLTMDDLYAVRRVAYRSLSRQSMEILYFLCLSWLDEDESSIEPRLRAAEACGWLNLVDKDGIDAFEKLYLRLSTDPEKVVREIAKRTWKERRNRVWSKKYLSIILEVKDDTNEDFLNSWRYGEALARIGDDTCLRVLQEHLDGEKNLPPHVRYWFGQINKEMEKNWRKVTQKWPEPWVSMRGAIEEGKGKIQVSKDKLIDINYSISHQPAAVPSEVHSWRGVMWEVPFIDISKIKKIKLEDGREANISISNISGGMAIFLGHGSYPSN